MAELAGEGKGGRRALKKGTGREREVKNGVPGTPAERHFGGASKSQGLLQLSGPGPELTVGREFMPRPGARIEDGVGLLGGEKRRFLCAMCAGTGFGSYAELKDHIRRAHGERKDRPAGGSGNSNGEGERNCPEDECLKAAGAKYEGEERGLAASRPSKSAEGCRIWSKLGAVSWDGNRGPGAVSSPQSGMANDGKNPNGATPNAKGASNQSSCFPLGQQLTTFNFAMNYVKEIKSRFKHNPRIYRQFLEILPQGREPEDVYNRIRQLFSDHPDLLEGFRYFLPSFSEGEKGSKYEKNNHVGSTGPKITKGQSTDELPCKRTEAERLDSILHYLKLGQYTEALAAKGFVTLESLRGLSKEGLKRVLEGINMKPGHQLKLRRLVDRQHERSSGNVW